MSLAIKSVPIVTDGAGAASATVRGAGMIIRRIDLELGTLSTPDVDITDEPTGTSVLSVDAVAADATYYPTIRGQDTTGAGSSNVGPTITLANPSAASDDIVDTATAHGFQIGDKVRFLTLTGGTGLSANVDYYVTATSFGASTFRPALTKGGAAIDFSTDITAGTVVRVDDYIGAFPFPVMGRLEIAVTGGGAAASGTFKILYER